MIVPAPGVRVRVARSRQERFLSYDAGQVGHLVKPDDTMSGVWLVKMDHRFAGTLVKVADLELAW